MIAVAAVIVGLVAIAVAYDIHYQKEIEAKPKQYLDAPAGLRWRDHYVRLLEGLLNRADKFFGPKKCSFQAYDRHLLLSLSYSIGFFILSWLFGNKTALGKLELFKRTDLEAKLIFCAYLIFIVIIVYFYAKYKKVWEEKLSSFLRSKFKLKKAEDWAENLILLVGLGVVGVVGVGGVGGVVGVGVVGVGGVGVVGVGVVGVVGVGGVGVGGVGVGGVGVGVGVGVVGGLGVINYFQGKPFWDLVLATWALFFIILPLLNSFFDLLSTGFSRWLGGKLKDDESVGWWKIAFLAVSDAVLAGLIFCGLLASFYGVLSAYNYFLPQFAIPPEELVKDFFTDPLGKGLWLWLMLLSTFIPTALHVIFTMSHAFILIFVYNPKRIAKARAGDVRPLARFLAIADTLRWFVLAGVGLGVIYTGARVSGMLPHLTSFMEHLK